MTLPDKTDLLAWIRDNPRHSTKRELARAFGLSGSERIELKRMLRELADAGEITKREKRHLPPGHLPPVTVCVGTRLDDEGILLARPQSAEQGEVTAPIRVIQRRGEKALGAGDRFLAKLTPHHDDTGLSYEARVIRALPGGTRRSLGVLRLEGAGGRIVPIDKSGDEMTVGPHDLGDAQDGDLVAVEAVPGPRMGPRRARVVESLGDPGAARAVSLIAIHQHGIPTDFSDAALAEADAAAPAPMADREDLRDVPLLTIDPADARDHDDAVAALPDDDPDNPGGFILWIAIADVAHYVRPGSALDREARRRGNSVYFPDRVVPMLPERLSGDLCSLHEGLERPCMALRVVLGADGRKRSHRFTRAMMRSHASLTYEQAQAIEDGGPAPSPEAGAAVGHLFGAFRCLWRAREARAPLHLDLPERRIELSEAGEVTGVALRQRLDAHKLIEECMILANVCAAETLEQERRALVYRVHEEPAAEKIESLREQVETIGLTLAKGQVLQTRHLNTLLDAAADGEFAELVNLGVLRSQTQAYYSERNFGHFGLNLPRYAHFTSPIRRYADLLVHRALIAAHGWGRDGQTDEEAGALSDTAEHISRTERRAMEAERDTNDRYLASYLSERLGAQFEGHVSGIARFGLFVKLDETGADGIVPIGTLGREYWRHDPETMTLTGEQSRQVIGMGDRVRVRLAEAAPVSGGLRFELLDVVGTSRPRATRGRRGETPKRKLGAARIKAAKAKRKARRAR